jgi:hypothetical protein
MKNIILAVALLYPACALAQGTGHPADSTKPPMVGDRPLLQVGSKKPAGKQPPANQQSVAQKLQACQEIDDGTKDRLNCYDAIYAPQPKPKRIAAKGVSDCRFMKEEDERLTCFNGFADKIPKLPQ